MKKEAWTRPAPSAAEHPPNYALPEHNTRVVYKTATTPGGGSHNEIHFEDKEGAEVMFINASKDQTLRVLDRKMEVVKNDHSREVVNDYELHVQNAITERVVGDQSLSIGGNEQRTIGGNRSIKTGGTHGIMVNKNRTLNVGAAMFDLTLGTIGEQSRVNATLVGGATFKLANETMAEETTDVSVQAIGGLKLENAGVSRSLDVAGKMIEKVLGSMLVKSNGKFFDTVEDSSLWTAASFTGKAPDILIEAEKSIRISCGGAVMTLTEDTLSIEAPKLDMSGAHLDADAESIDHN
jgi:type VI secretion system secreted protein VgrG